MDLLIMVSFCSPYLHRNGLNRSRKSVKRLLNRSKRLGFANIRMTLVRIISFLEVRIPLYSHHKVSSRCKILAIIC